MVSFSTASGTFQYEDLLLNQKGLRLVTESEGAPVSRLIQMILIKKTCVYNFSHAFFLESC